MTAREVRRFCQNVRGSVPDLVRELGFATHYMDEAREYAGEPASVADSLAGARDCLRQVSLAAGNLADQIANAEKELVR